MKKYIVSICLGMVFLSSCSNWLDVQPKTTVEEEKVFSRELGFKEALTGVYIKMASTDLYARNLSYGFIDILGQRYQASDALTYQNELWYTFPSTKTESYTKTIWEKMYNIIANVNNLLYYCDENKQVFTTGHYYEIIKGAALGFRAFLVGVTNTKLLSGAALTAVCINIPFNYLLIFKLYMGISGAAMASSIAEFGAFLILLLYMCKTVDKKKYGLSAVYDGRLLMKLLQLSVWSMLHAFISVAPWFLFFLSIEHLGKTELAISNITRSVSTLFFVIVNSFASTTGSLVSNLIGAGQGKELFPVCRKVLRLGYVVGLPLILTALWGNQWIIGFYTNNDNLVRLAFYPFIVMLLNYAFALPGYVYINAVTGTGKTKLAFIFQLITILVYLIYLYLLSECFHASLTVYMTAEYLFVILLGIQSIIYLKRKSN